MAVGEASRLQARASELTALEAVLFASLEAYGRINLNFTSWGWGRKPPPPEFACDIKLECHYGQGLAANSFLHLACFQHLAMMVAPAPLAGGLAITSPHLFAG